MVIDVSSRMSSARRAPPYANRGWDSLKDRHQVGGAGEPTRAAKGVKVVAGRGDGDGARQGQEEEQGPGEAKEPL